MSSEIKNRLEICNIEKKFKKNEVLKKLSCTLESGVYAILAPNGVGKTTLMRCIADIYTYNGEILFNGKNIKKQKTKQKNEPQKIELKNNNKVSLDNLFQKAIEENEVQYEMYHTEDAELVFVAYGTVSRIVKTTVDQLREEGYKVGLIRPKTLWPYPNEAFKKIPNAKNLLVVEMSLGQMIDDVKLACECKLPVHFYGRSGGMIPVTSDIAQKAKEIMGEVALGGAK